MKKKTQGGINPRLEVPILSIGQTGTDGGNEFRSHAAAATTTIVYHPLASHSTPREGTEELPYLLVCTTVAVQSSS